MFSLRHTLNFWASESIISLPLPYSHYSCKHLSEQHDIKRIAIGIDSLATASYYPLDNRCVELDFTFASFFQAAQSSNLSTILSKPPAGATRAKALWQDGSWKSLQPNVCDQRQCGFHVQDSGTSRSCIVCDSTQVEEQFILDLCEVSNTILSKLIQDKVLEQPVDDAFAATEEESSSTSSSSFSNQFYNCCLVYWYQPQHHIGLHADDERELNLQIPIASLSWGGPRRFLLRPKEVVTQTAKSKVHEVLLGNGDLLFMGGKCQEEFKHEIPKVRKMDGQVNERISWTVRSMNTPSNNVKKKRSSNGDKRSAKRRR